MLGRFRRSPVTLFGSARREQSDRASREIRQAAKTITAQRLDQQLPVPPTNDEIAGLIEVLNRDLSNGCSAVSNNPFVFC